MIVDSAIYVDGRSDAPSARGDPGYLAGEGGFARLAYEPTREEFDPVAGEFGMHELAVKEALKIHQRPKIERFGETVFVVLKAARYVEEREEVEFGEIHAFVGSDFVVTIRYGEANELGEVRRWAERPDLLRKGPYAVLYAIMDRIVEDYIPWSLASRTTSTRSRSKSSKQARTSPAHLRALPRGDPVPPGHAAAGRGAGAPYGGGGARIYPARCAATCAT